MVDNRREARDFLTSRFWVDWEVLTAGVVGSLRASATRDPYDRDLTDLIGELATRSERFRQLWGGSRPGSRSSGETAVVQGLRERNCTGVPFWPFVRHLRSSTRRSRTAVT
nr:hypothetical protein [Nocardia abscessus]